MIRNIEAFEKELEKINSWWLTDKLSLPHFLERQAFRKVIDELNGKRIIQIIGARRVGKTVMLRQTIQYLITGGTNPRNILYYSLDDPSLYPLSDNLLKDIFDFWLENIAQQGRKYVFFDEVHSFEGWHKWLKAFFDRYADDIRFIISGSSSLALQREANIYLRGRSIDIKVWPFSFQEFLEFSGTEAEICKFEDIIKLKSIDVTAIKQKAHFDKYLLVGGFPEWFESKEVSKWFEKLLNDVPKKAIYEDVAKLFNIRSVKTLENIFAFIVENQSHILTYEKINEVAGLQRSILLNYLEFLKSAFLILEIPLYAKSVKTQMKAKKKFLVVDQGIRNAALKNVTLKQADLGFIAENVVGVHLFKQGEVFYFRVNGEVDFVLKTDGGLIPIEVKYREDPRYTDTLLEFMDEHKLSEGVIVTKDLFKQEKIAGKQIYYIPLWLFLLCEF